MRDNSSDAREACRVTCIVHHDQAAAAQAIFSRLGVAPVFEQSGRCVRQYVRRRRRWMGLRRETHHEPMDLLRCTVRPGEAAAVVSALAEAMEFNTPGQGSIYGQKVEAYYPVPPLAATAAAPDEAAVAAGRRLQDLTLLTAITAASSSEENRLALAALDLGAGVPWLCLGEGTGIRDRLGLLRITIPAEKEILQLVVPAHDAHSILGLLIEEGRMDRPGGGFLYGTPVQSGTIDPLMRMGDQRHAASVEQIIAAVDELKGGTAWRKRLAGTDDPRAGGNRIRVRQKEIIFCCPEGQAGSLIAAAMQSGAGGGTVTRVRRLGADLRKSDPAAQEQGLLCVPETLCLPVVETLLRTSSSRGEDCDRVEVMDSPLSFSHK